MKRIVLLVLATMGWVALSAQGVIDNPSKPKNPAAGRVLTPQKVSTITDDPGKFFFKEYLSLEVAGDGSLFVSNDACLLGFDAGGKFRGKFLSKGEGPGEVGEYFDFFISGQEIYIFDPQLDKLLVTNLEGKVLKESRLSQRTYIDLVGVSSQGPIFVRSELPTPEKRKKNGFHEVMQHIVAVTEDSWQEKPIYTSRLQWYFVVEGNTRGMSAYSHQICLLKGDRELIVSDTPAYLVKIVDIKTGQVKRLFRRNYQRIKYREPEKISTRRSVHFPARDFFDDIGRIYLVGDQIWVMTSTTDKAGRCLIDVFNDKGEYLDNFFLDIKLPIIGTTDRFLFTTATDEEDNIVIVKWAVPPAS